MKLKFKYLNKTMELYTAIDRLLQLSKNIIIDKKYELQYISARTGIELSLCEDVLEYLAIGGFYIKDQSGAYYRVD